MKKVFLLLWVAVAVWANNDIDKLRSHILQTAITVYFSNQGYGSVKEMKIDSDKKEMELHFVPEGEKEKMVINVGKYEQKRVEKKEFLILQNIRTNRLWLTRIFADHMKEGIKIPLNGTMGALPLILGL